MTGFVALLRGLNVGRGARVPMAELRELATGLGWRGVRTHLQSGNIAFSVGDPADPGRLAGTLTAAVADRFGVTADAVVLPAARFRQLASADPYPAASGAAPKTVHLVVVAALTDDLRARVAAADERSRGTGSPDRAQLAAGALWLHTPDGFGTSDLAARLTRVGGVGPGVVATARNAATVRALLTLLDEVADDG